MSFTRAFKAVVSKRIWFPPILSQTKIVAGDACVEGQLGFVDDVRSNQMDGNRLKRLGEFDLSNSKRDQQWV